MALQAYSRAAKRRARVAARAVSLPPVRMIRPRLGLVVTAAMAVEAAALERDKRMAGEQMAKRRVQRTSPMDRYLARREITSQQHADGERLLADWARAGLEPQIVASWSRAMACGLGPGEGPGYVAYTAAMRTVGIILSPILAAVVLGGEQAGDWAAAHHRERREGMTILRLALDALGSHYRPRGNQATF